MKRNVMSLGWVVSLVGYLLVTTCVWVLTGIWSPLAFIVGPLSIIAIWGIRAFLLSSVGIRKH